MTARRGDDLLIVPRVDERGGDGVALGERGTRAVHAEEREIEVAGDERRGNDLIEQVARHEQIDALLRFARVGDRLIDGVREHFTLRFLVRTFAEHIVRQRFIHVFSHDPRAFLRSGDRARRDDTGFVFEKNRLHTFSLQEQINDTHDRTRQHAEHDDRACDDEHFRRHTVHQPFRLELDRGRGYAVGKTRYGNDRTRARVTPDTVVHAKPRQQRAQEDEDNAHRTRKLVADKPERAFENDPKKLTDTADEPAHHKGAETVFEMLGRWVE